MSLEFKVEPPYPFEAKVVLQNGNTLKAEIIYLEWRGCIVEMASPFLKTGDKITIEFSLPEKAGSFKESSVIVKIYIQFKDGKPRYLSELHFKKPSKESTKIIEEYLHDNTRKKKMELQADVKTASDKK